MVAVKGILFPTDLTPASSKVAPYVEFMAQGLGASVKVLYVERKLDDFGFLGLDVDDYTDLLRSYGQEMDRKAKEGLASFVKDNLASLEGITTRIIEGDPRDEIVREAESAGVDMIIMGTHGRKGINKVMFGSVASAVVANAPCPVMTVNPFKVEG